MDPKGETSKRLRILEDLNVATLVDIIERENLAELKELVEEKQLDGRKLLNLTEGIVKLWRPKVNAKQFINFIENLKRNPHSYIQPYDNTNKSSICIRSTSFNGIASTTKEMYALESKTMTFEGNTKSTSNNKQTRVRKISKSQNLEFNTNNAETIERIFRYSEPPKSFLYRNKIKEMRKRKELNQGKDIINSSYVPMDVGNNPNKERNTIASKIHDYIHFDLSKLKILPTRKEGRFDDRGYYALKRASMATEISDSYDIVGIVDFGKPKKNISTESERLNELDEHFYEDLNIDTEIREPKLRRGSVLKDFNPLSKSPCMLKINEIFSTFRFPHNKMAQFTPNSTIISNNDKNEKCLEIKNTADENQSCPSSSLKEERDRKSSQKFKSKSDTINHIYEYNENSSGLYDSIEAGLNEVKSDIVERFQAAKIPVEEYLEPIHPNRDYADVMYKDKEDSIVNIILKMFEDGFGFHKECEKTHHSTPTLDSSKPSISNPEFLEPPERPMETLKKWNDNLKANHKPESKTNMADRPLPVPVENEFYYMEVDRLEASKLLQGHADGTFILRPSSQPFHAYTISLVYKGQVHNVGVRRRPDGRLALGFSKRSEQTFATITELVEHHYRDKLLLIVDGQKIGSTQLRRLHD